MLGRMTPLHVLAALTVLALLVPTAYYSLKIAGRITNWIFDRLEPAVNRFLRN